MFFRVLGQVGFDDEYGNPIPLRPKERHLLAIFLIDAGKVVSVDRIADAMWGDSPPKNPEAAIHVHVARLRTALDGSDVISTRPPGYMLRVEGDQFDAAVFERLLGEARSALDAGSAGTAEAKLMQADSLWGGEAYVEFADEPFASIEAQRLNQLRQVSKMVRLECLIRLGSAGAAIPDLRSMVRADPLDEQATGLLAIALYEEGRQAEALEAIDAVRRSLRDEVGAVPSQRTEDVYEAILRHDPILTTVRAGNEEVGEPQAPSRSGRARLSNLPAPVTSFVGRKGDLERLQEMIDTRRLVTITGPGGIGKTRLALEAASERVGSPTDGVWLVEMGELRTPDAVVSTVLARLPVPDGPAGSPLQLLTGWLEERELLIVLDDCERSLEPVADLVDHMLRHAPRLRIIATSREPLGVPGEALLPVPLLVLPDEHWADLGTLAANESVRLFVDRARSIESGFELDERSAAPVVRICRALDGIPLALELAASHCRRRSVEEIAGLAERDGARLETTYRLAQSRHRTMASTVDWSYELLDEQVRRVFRRVSVFVGWFDPEAVAALSDWGIDEAAAGLSRLSEQSLLVAAPGSYRMLQPVRARAFEMLTDLGEADETVVRHARFFLATGADAEQGIRGRVQGEWLRRLERYIVEIRSAIEWGLAHEPRLAVDAILGVSEYLYMSASFTETMTLLSRGLEVATPGQRIRIELMVGRVQSRESAVDAVRTLRHLIDGPLEPSQRMEARLWAAQALGDQGDSESAAAVMVTLEEADALGDPWIGVEARRVASNLAFMSGDAETALELAHVAYEFAVEAELPWFISRAASNLARHLAFQRGEVEEALRLVDEARRVGLEYGSVYLVAFATLTELIVRASSGEAPASLVTQVEAMYEWMRIGLSDRFMGIALEQLAYILTQAGHFEDAALCHGAAHPDGDSIPFFAMKDFHEETVSVLNDVLGVDRLRDLEDVGRATPSVDLLATVEGHAAG